MSTTAKPLVSECGKYRATRLGHLEYRITDASGVVVCDRTTFWSNRSTKRRIRFVTGSGPFEATFSYPRHPRNFWRRWVECWDVNDSKELLAAIQGVGVRVTTFGKLAMTCDYLLGFVGTPEQRNAVDSLLTERGLKFATRQKPGMWDIEYCTKGVGQ